MDGCMGEIKSKVVNAGAKLRLNGEVWSIVTCLFADDIVLLAEREGDLQRVVNEFYSVYKRRKLKVNAGKSKVMMFERRKRREGEGRGMREYEGIKTNKTNSHTNNLEPQIKTKQRNKQSHKQS